MRCPMVTAAKPLLACTQQLQIRLYSNIIIIILLSRVHDIIVHNTRGRERRKPGRSRECKGNGENRRAYEGAREAT